MTPELCGFSAAELGRRIARGDFTSREVCSVYLERLALVNARVNAVLGLDPEWTLEEAGRADARLRAHGPLSPLHGVPVSLKDSLETRDLVTTAGTLGLQGKRARRDAAVVERLRGAGMVPLVKSSVPELCMGLETDNFLVGATVNPWDPVRTAGGSSGGEAALLALQASAVGLGSDTGGSIRNPAHFCGVYGLKPTTGRVPRTGHLPGWGGPTDGLWQIGPMGRHLEDLELVLRLIAGPDGEDPDCAPVDLEPAERQPLRAGFYVDNGLMAADPETTELVRRSARLLSQAGWEVEEVRPPGCEEAWDLLIGIFAADQALGLRRLLDKLGTRRVHPLVERFLQLVEPRACSAVDYCHVRYRWARLRGRMLAFSARYPLLLAPVCAGPAPALGASPWSAEVLPYFSYTVFFNLLGWPAISVPAGLSSSGLPLGLQLAAAPWREHRLLEAARTFEPVVNTNVTATP